MSSLSRSVQPSVVGDAGGRVYDSAESEPLERSFVRCADGLYRFLAVRTGGDSALADDLIQQVWLKAQASRRHVPAGEVEFWLRGIARNLVRSHWRAHRRGLLHLPLADPRLAADLAQRLETQDLPDDALQQREVCDQLLLAITELPAADQQLIVAHYFEGRTHAELAEGLGCGERAIEGRLYRARQALRRTLREL